MTVWRWITRNGFLAAFLVLAAANVAGMLAVQREHDARLADMAATEARMCVDDHRQHRQVQDGMERTVRASASAVLTVIEGRVSVEVSDEFVEAVEAEAVAVRDDVDPPSCDLGEAFGVLDGG